MDTAESSAVGPRARTTSPSARSAGSARSPRSPRSPRSGGASRSRREDIVDAAVRLFARQGFVDASIADVADEADVAVAAIYYHFASKDELFEAAVDRVFDRISAAAASARTRAEAEAPGVAKISTLDVVIDAVWEWVDTHPDEATLVHLQLPGATPRIARRRKEFEELHVRQAFGYLPATSGGRPSASRRVSQMLTVRTLVDLLVSVHTMRLADGPLSDRSSPALRSSVRELVHRLVDLDT